MSSVPVPTVDLDHLTVSHGSAAVQQRYGEVMMNTFGPPKRVFVRGEGSYVWDAEGRRYLDLLAGLAVNALGHAHPYVLSAITSQLSTLGHVSNFFATPAQVALADRLAAMTGAAEARVFFTNSGTEANEAAFKITRATGRTRLISFEGAFHGRSLGALALTHNPKYRVPFEPLPGAVSWLPYGDAEALETALADAARGAEADRVAAVVVEPIQGENGVVTPPADFLGRARQACDRHGALLWVDEVQTGIGRTGHWLAHRSTPQAPVADLITVAKGLGNGFPVGACLATGRAAGLLTPGSHGTTFGGNPVAAVAGLAVLRVIERDGLLAHVQRAGANLRDKIRALDHPMITEVRGAGFLIGIQLREPVAAAVADAALEQFMIINAPRPDVLRLAPPLITTEDQLQQFVDVLPGLLATSTTGSP